MQCENQIYVLNTKFKIRAINFQDLKNVFKSIKKKPDHIKISSNIILDNWGILGNILLRFINRSLRTEAFPSNCKKCSGM